MHRWMVAAAFGLGGFFATILVGIVQGWITGMVLPAGALLFVALAVGGIAAALGGGLPGKPVRLEPANAVAATVRPSERQAALSAEPLTTAIVFRQHLPPRHDPRHRSYFGGVPMGGPDFDWPRWNHEGIAEPLHFILQVDCAALPASARKAGFPAAGALAFFLDLRWGHSNGFRVIHIEDAGGSPAPVPHDLAAAYGAEARHAWRWTAGLDDPTPRCPRLLPKWSFDPVEVAIPEGPIAAWRRECAAEEGNPVFWWPDVEEMHGALLEAQERGAAPSILPPERDSMARPTAEYPQDWRAIEIGAALMIAQADRKFRYANSDHRLRGLSAEERTAMQARIGGEAREWLSEAGAHAPFDPVPASVRDAFWAWLASWENFTRYFLKDAGRLAIEAALAESAEAAARIPAEGIERIRAGHALATRTSSGIFAVTPDRMLAPPSAVQGDQEETAQSHLLLLELSSNDGLGHYFGEGVYQFWITPADLRNRRFDRARLTTSAY